MNYVQIVLFSFSVWMAAIVGLVRFNKIDQAYYPFIFCLWIASLNELLSFYLSNAGATTIINNNVYILLEALLITWQFKQWEHYGRNSNLYSITLAVIFIAWLMENLGFSSIYKVGLYFRIFYSLVIVLMSINIASWVIVNSRGVLLKNPMFLICIGYIIFFTFKIVTEAFWLYGVKVSNEFSIQVFMTFTWINLFVNLLFVIAVLCIPPRRHFLSFS